MSVRADVDRGLAVREEIKKLETELKDIEVRLKAAGMQNPGAQVDLADADREGKQYLAAGSSRIVPVVFTSDLLVGEFGRGSQRQMQIVDAVAHQPGDITKFFKPVSKFENLFSSGKKFRALAAEVFGENAPAFITACLARDKDGIPKSAIKVVWDDAKPKP